jgi:putative flippase GtrA
VQPFGRSLARYAVTGGVAAVVDIGGFACLSAASMPTVLAATCSFLAATVVNYLLTAWFVFSVTVSVRRYVTFLAGSLFALLINVSLTSTGVILLSVPRTMAKTIAIGVTFFVNFWVNARLIFNHPTPPATPPPPVAPHPSDSAG